MARNDIAKIKANVRRYVAAWNAGDADALQKTLANDVLYMPPDAPRLKGSKATAEWGKKTLIDLFRIKLRVRFDRVQVFGSQAVASGAFRVELTPKTGGNTTKGVGKFMNVFKRHKDKSWKYAQVIWNFDKPPA